jgi:OOP family OmpA-OmpF porin
MVKRPALYLPSLRRAAQSAPIAFLGAGCLAVLTAYGAVNLIETVSGRSVKTMLLSEGITWADVTTDGLQVHLVGTAPNEAARYRVVNLVASSVDSARVRDDLDVAAVQAVEAPRFSLEILRNDDGIQIIGLLPSAEQETALTTLAKDLAQATPLSEMIETAASPATPGWEAALAFGTKAFEMLPRSKISISENRVEITAISTSASEKRIFDEDLAAAIPQGLITTIDVSAPRPVITPFTLRYVKDAQGQRFDACAADTEVAQDVIISAAQDAGSLGADCIIGLGVPSPSWAQAAKAGIFAVSQLVSGTITFKDADVTLQAGSDVSQADFDRIVGDLQAALPQVFSLNATLEPRAEGRSEGPAEFTAALDQKTRRVEMRGRLTDEILRLAVDNFAKAEFGSDNVYQATVLDPNLPEGWPVRVMAGLQALAQLQGGSLTARADMVSVKGVTGSTAVKARISQILSDKLGQGQAFRVDVTYDKALDPIASLPTPKECIDKVAKVLASKKIIFPPSSSDIDADADQVMDALAKALKGCAAVKIEIGGHTDGQGSEGGNLSLSQARADAILLALRMRQVDVSGFTAKGYGEQQPLGDNETDAGREANRRIEFKLATAVAAAAPIAKTTDAADAKLAESAAESAGEAAANLNAPTDAATGDLSGDATIDDAPSVAPKTITLKPKKRPAKP